MAQPRKTQTQLRHERFIDVASIPDDKGIFQSFTDAFIAVYEKVEGEYKREFAKRNAYRLLTDFPEVRAAISARRLAALEVMRDEAMALPIARQTDRLAIKQALIDKALTLIAERAIGEGSATGLEVVDWRGKDADRKVTKFDGPLVAEIRNLLDSAGKELGQIVERVDATTMGKPLPSVTIFLPDNGRDSTPNTV